MTRDEEFALKIVKRAAIGIGVAFAAWLIVSPIYGVWEQRLLGQAELQRAQSNRMIAVQEAEAKKEAAAMLAEAEITRAKGVAQANQIIGESLKENEAYLRYLWIQNLEHTQNATVYIPTEAGLPILEANRLRQGQK